MPKILYKIMVIIFILNPLNLSAATITAESSEIDSGLKSSTYMIYGQGRQLCRMYTQSRKQALAKQFLQLNYFRQWMAGYMSSHNKYSQHHQGVVAGSGDEGLIEEWLDAYCSEHPDKSFAYAAEAVVQKLISRQ